MVDEVGQLSPTDMLPEDGQEPRGLELVLSLVSGDIERYGLQDPPGSHGSNRFPHHEVHLLLQLHIVRGSKLRELTEHGVEELRVEGSHLLSKSGQDGKNYVPRCVVLILQSIAELLHNLATGVPVHLLEGLGEDGPEGETGGFNKYFNK